MGAGKPIITVSALRGRHDQACGRKLAQMAARGLRRDMCRVSEFTDTQGNLVGLVVHQADIQDRDGAPCVLASIRSLYPWLRHIFADGGYAGEKLREALKRIGEWTLEIIRRSDTAQGFEVLPRRWVVERTFAAG